MYWALIACGGGKRSTGSEGAAAVLIPAWGAGICEARAAQ